MCVCVGGGGGGGRGKGGYGIHSNFLLNLIEICYLN